jgi:DNA-binding transcriptional MerR regulator
MDIREVSKVSGLPPSTLRFYEEKGLIQSSGRNGLRRVFQANIIERLALISLGRNAGFSLDEISLMFTSNRLEVDREFLLQKADQMDKKIIELTAMRNGLRHAAACPESNHLECETFLRLMKIAGKSRFRPKPLNDRK